MSDAPSHDEHASADTRPSRRAFLRKAVRGALVGAGVVAAGALAVRLGGYSIDERRAAYLKALSPWHVVVLDAVAARMCLADVSYDSIGAPPTPRDVGVTEFIDGFLAAAHPSIRRDALALVGLVEHVWPVRCGHATRFSKLPPDVQDDVLAKMEAAEGPMSGLLRGAFQGLKTLVMMGYWRDPRTWGVLRYDGPLVNRPEGGWTPLRYRPLVVRGAR